jgi:hypothetical protein
MLSFGTKVFNFYNLLIFLWIVFLVVLIRTLCLTQGHDNLLLCFLLEVG